MGKTLGEENVFDDLREFVRFFERAHGELRVGVSGEYYLVANMDDIEKSVFVSPETGDIKTGVDATDSIGNVKYVNRGGFSDNFGKVVELLV